MQADQARQLEGGEEPMDLSDVNNQQKPSRVVKMDVDTPRQSRYLVVSEHNQIPKRTEVLIFVPGRLKK